MAASSISMLALLLLMSAVTPGLSTEGEGSQDHTSTALIIAMREVSRNLEGFGDAVQEGLRQQRQSRDALTDLHTLTATVLRVEERINQQGGMIESLKEKNEGITKVETLTQEIEDLKNQLHNKNQTVGDLQRLLDDKTSENERNVDKLDDLQMKFEGKSRESENNLEKVEALSQEIEDLRNQLHNKNHTVEALTQEIDDLKNQLHNKNHTLESKKKDVPGCAEQPPQKIKNLVLQYSGSRDWQTLWWGLDAEMDHSSEAYGELKNMDQNSGNPHWHMGIYGYTQLATLLLGAGMPVDLPDKDNFTLLHGSAYGGCYQLAEMLLSRGADVKVRDIYYKTPLIAAAYNGHLETVKLLVQAGADTTATDKYGYNALYYAKIYSYTAVQQYLEQFPA